MARSRSRLAIMHDHTLIQVLTERITFTATSVYVKESLEQ